VVKLHEVLPVPTRPIPFEDLLEFRLRRLDEAVALRAHIEDLYEAILSSPDQPLALARALERIAAATADQCTVLEEAGVRFTFAGLEAGLKWEFDVKISAVSGLITALLTQSPAAGGFASAVSNLIPRVEISSAAGVAGTTGARLPYGYIIHINRELL
jgi:hypothetical protein